MGEQNLAARVRAALDAGEGILRLAPTWVPRSFLMPGGRLKLAREDLYALGTPRGGIDERWFASTTPAANEGAPPDEGGAVRRVRCLPRRNLSAADPAARRAPAPAHVSVVVVPEPAAAVERQRQRLPIRLHNPRC